MKTINPIKFIYQFAGQYYRLVLMQDKKLIPFPNL